MIKEKTCVAMYEIGEILKEAEETDRTKEVRAFIKKFMSLDEKKSKKLKEELKKLDMMKLKEQDILKIVDILPENAAELNKIVIEASLDADETAKILDTIKNNS
jgi:DNA-directed RNA polymerase subunit F